MQKNKTTPNKATQSNTQPTQLNQVFATVTPTTQQKRNTSTVTNPVAVVHAYLNKMLPQLKNGTVTRAQVLAVMVNNGINKHTAQTQYAKFAKANGLTNARAVINTAQINALINNW